MSAERVNCLQGKGKFLQRLVVYLCLLHLVASACAREHSYSLAYGPGRQLVATAGVGAWSLYGQPFLSFVGDESSDFLEAGGRWGAMYSHTALAWKRFEVRAQAGAGLHYAYRRRDLEPSISGGSGHSFTSTQKGAEIWLQPEFRFQGRFALLLDAVFLRYLFTEDSEGFDEESAGFITPELSLNSLGFGVRYYLVFGKP